MKHKKKLCALAGIVALSCCFTGMSLSAFADDGNTVAVIPEKAYIGDTVVVPETVLVDGTAKAADVRIIAPDGSTYTGEKVVLNGAGKYIFEYFVDGAKVDEDTCICMRRPQDIFNVNGFANCLGQGAYKYDESKSGLKFSVEKGAQVSYSREIDMTQFTKNDVLLELMVEPSKAGVADFTNYTITFTDVEDENSTLNLYMTDCGAVNCGGTSTYVRAGGNGQVAGGWDYAGGEYTWITTTIYGTALASSFLAVPFPDQYRTLQIYYDDAEHAVYGSYGFDYRLPGKILIADLDDTATFGAAIWEGFTSGKVRMSISFDGFASETGTFMMMQCGGFDLTAQEYEDVQAPEITVDLGGADRAPDSVVGYDYPLFAATAKDDFDETSTVSTRVVYTNPATGVKTDVAVNGDTFKTMRNGIYTIVYTSRDLSGNEAKEEISFFCSGESRDIVLSTTDAPRSVDLYEKVQLGGVESVTASGGNGSLRLGCTVYAPNGDEVELTDNAFVPDQLGAYKVVYSATDYFGEVGTKEILVTVNALEKPKFIDGATLPAVLISGFTYDLPTLTAMECVGGKILATDVKTYVNGIEAKGSFVAPETATAEIVYKSNGTSGTADEVKYVLPVVNGKGGTDQAAYFYSKDGVVATEEQMYVTLSATKAGSVRFANALNPEEFALNMAFAEGKSNFARLAISLSSWDGSKKVTFKLHFDGTSIVIETPDGTRTALATLGTSFALKYSNSDLLLRDCDNVAFGLVRTTDDGQAFRGFDGAVWLDIAFEEVTGESALHFTSLNNQNLGYRRPTPEEGKDEVAPQIVIGGEYVYQQAHGATLKIHSAQAYDVLGEVESFTVRVTSPKGNSLLPANASALESYEIKLDEIGVYKIVYTAIDSNGVKSNTGATVEAADSTLPTLNVNLSKIKTNNKVGAKINLPKISAEDDSGIVYYDVYVQMPDNSLRYLIHCEDGEESSFIKNYGSSFAAGDRSFKLTQKGKYILTVMAYDANFNIVMSNVEITAK